MAPNDRRTTTASSRPSTILNNSNRATSKRSTRGDTRNKANYSGLQVMVQGKNMTPLPLLKPPTNDSAYDTHTFVPGSEPGSPELPVPNNHSSGPLTLSPPLSPTSPQDDSGGRSPTLRRQSSRTSMEPGATKIRRALSFTRRASSGDALKQQQQQQVHHSHGHKHDEGPALPYGLKREDLKKPVTFSLTESKTITLFHIASSCVADDDPKLNAIKTKNAQYAELCAAKLGGSDKYIARSAQTLNLAVKEKQTETIKTVQKNASSLAVGFKIEDDYRTKQSEEDAMFLGESKEKDSDGPKELQKEVSAAVDAALAAPGALLSIDNDTKNMTEGTHRKGTGEPWSATSNGSENGEEPTIEEVTAQQLKGKVMASKNLENALHTVERAVMQNMFHARQLRYRGLPNASDALDGSIDMPSSFLSPQTPLSPAPVPNSVAMTAEPSPLSHASPVPVNLDANQPQTPSLQQAQQVPPTSLQSANGNGAYESNEEGKSKLIPLFDFICAETKGRTIHTMAFNKANFDVLAVAYGSKQPPPRASTPHSAQLSLGSGEAKEAPAKDEGGLVAFWSLRNPDYPERLIHTLTGVTALDFSSRIPNLLAVGLQDGTVAIYNLKRDGGDLGVPILDSSSLPTKHMEAVWQVRWVDKGTERGECLVSVSTDGRIAEWSMKKGLASTTLMVLRRSGNAEGSISRTAAGLSFDFPIGDPNTYFAGAEDGTLHRCSCSYTEQSLEATPGHAGPIYRVRCSPKHPSAILTCGADWSVKLWHKGSCVQTFHPGDLTDAVHDVCWSPLSSTVFASVAGDGRVEVWDLANSKLDPAVSMFSNGTVNEDTYEDYDDPDFKGEILPAQTSVLFAPVSKVLLVGDEFGRVKLYELVGIDLSPEFADPQRLVDAMKGSRP